MPLPGTKSGQKIISLTGDLGSGKSTVAAMLEQRWGVPRYYAGGFFRELALEKGVSISDITSVEKYGTQYHHLVDGKFKTLADTGVDMIGEGRMAWHCLPTSFKIKLNVCAEVAAQRIFRDKMRKAEHVDGPDQILDSIRARQSTDQQQYQQIYHVDIEDEKNFDLVIDTANVPPNEVADLIDRLTTKYFSGEHFEKHWMAPKSMYPSVMIDVSGDGLTLPVDEFDHDPITVVDIGRLYLIADGHTRTSKALIAGVPFIPVRVVGAPDIVPGRKMTGRDFYQDHLHDAAILEWANVHGFHYLVMPKQS
jgi:CMP/dCMP kinase